MDLLQALATMMSFTAFGLVGAAVLKAFQIANDLSEIKEILRDVRRDADTRASVTQRPAEAQVDVDPREMTEAQYLAAIQAQAGLPQEAIQPSAQPAGPVAYQAPAYQPPVAPAAQAPAYTPEALAAPVPQHSPETLLKAVNAESELPALGYGYSNRQVDETPVLQPEVIQPRSPGV